MVTDEYGRPLTQVTVKAGAPIKGRKGVPRVSKHEILCWGRAIGANLWQVRLGLQDVVLHSNHIKVGGLVEIQKSPNRGGPNDPRLSERS